jgi:hypothetical protein
MRRSAAIVVLIAACGGGGEGQTPDAAAASCSGFVGDPARAVEVESIFTEPDGYVETPGGEEVLLAPVPGTNGMRVPLIQAPQGGKHIFAGVRARNLDTCAVFLLGEVRDPESNFVKFEGRAVDLLDGGDGWAYPARRDQIGYYANINVCPNRWSSRDVFEQSYRVTLEVRDRAGRTGEVALDVTPFCGAEPQHEADCRCSCRKDAVLGECPADADGGLTPR